MDEHQKLVNFENKVDRSTNFCKWDSWDDILGILNTNYQDYMSSNQSNLQIIVI